MAENLPEPASRKEQYLATIAGMTGIDLPEPASRIEEYLNAIAQNGGGGGGGGTSYTAGDGINITDNTISVDTTTIQPKLTAGTNVNISNNTISATDTTYNNFIGTNGTVAGAAGLVPAPTALDANKYLKSDGSWATIGGGALVTLTALSSDWGADPTNSPFEFYQYIYVPMFVSPTAKLELQTGNGDIVTLAKYGIVILGYDQLSNQVCLGAVTQPDTDITVNITVS